MAVNGGAAAKAGIQYERQWVVLALLDVLDGKAQSVQPEVKGEHGIDFLVMEDGTQIWHQAKHRPSVGQWTIAALDSPQVRVLRTCWEKVRAGGRFVLDSSTGAQPLEALTKGADRAGSWESFKQDTLGEPNSRRHADFERLREAWGYPEPEAAYQALKNVVVNHTSEEDLLFRLRTRLAEQVEGPPEQARMALELLVDHSTLSALTAADAWNWLAASGIAPRKRRRLSAAQRAAIVTALALGSAAGIGVPALLRPAPIDPWQRPAVPSLGTGSPHQPDTVPVPASSLSSTIAQLPAKRLASADATGYILRSAFTSVQSPSYCLTAVTTGQKAGQDGDGVEATACKPGSLSQVWIPVYAASGTASAWLVSAEYPSMCLNADNGAGKGVHQGSKVQLWNCYPPRANPARFNEWWDFGTWLRAMKAGWTSYPLFLGAGNYSLDADIKSLKGGMPTASVSIIRHYKVSWEYWY